MQDPSHGVADPDRGVNLDGEGFREFELEAESQHIQARPNSTDFLNGLRGLAALLVYIQHNVPGWYGTSETDYPFGYHGEHYFIQLPFIRVLYAGGNPAVAVFFVLSGYVLSASSLKLLHDGKRSECRKNLIPAFVRRPVRLFGPPLGTTLTFALLLHLPFVPQTGWLTAEPNLFLELKRWVVESLGMMNPVRPYYFFEHWRPYGPETWTMAFEYRGSLLVFALLAVSSYLSPRQCMVLYSAVGIVSLAFCHWTMSCFMGGLLLALTSQERHDHRTSRRCSSAVQTVIPHMALIAALHLFSQPHGKFDMEISSSAWGFGLLTELIPPSYRDKEHWRFYETIGAFLLVYSVLKLQWLQRVFRTRAMLYLGHVSFSLYLTQYVVFYVAGEYIVRALGRTLRTDIHTIFDNLVPVPDIGPRGLSTGFLVSQAILLPLHLYVASLTTRYLDRPSIACSKWLVSKLGLASK